MPANSTHPDYDANLAAWLRARDVIAGEDAVKAGGTMYLPRLEEQKRRRSRAAGSAPAAPEPAILLTSDGHGHLAWTLNFTTPYDSIAIYQSADGVSWALVMATRLIDGAYQFNGTRSLAMQALQWPRMDCREPDGTTAEFTLPGAVVTPHYVISTGDGQIVVVTDTFLVPGDMVPKAVVEATCELARELLVADRTAAPAGEGLKYYNNAGVQTGYDKNDTRPVIPKLVQAMLAKYGSLINARSGTVKLVRT